MENGCPYRARTPLPVIASAMEIYFSGSSTAKTSRLLRKVLRVHRSDVAVWKWIVKYPSLARDYTAALRAQTSPTWHADETVIDTRVGKLWQWEVEDQDTRYILTSMMTGWGRESQHAVDLFAHAKAVGVRPERIVTDGLRAYVEGVRRNFYTNRANPRGPNGVKHVNRIHFAQADNNNLIERFHGSVKERTKTLRHFKRADTAKAILDGWIIAYNFLREHESLGGLTPAVKAGIDLPFEDGWGDLIRWATYFRARVGQLS